VSYKSHQRDLSYKRALDPGNTNQRWFRFLRQTQGSALLQPEQITSQGNLYMSWRQSSYKTQSIELAATARQLNLA
jgi:hypothetical protein